MIQWRTFLSDEGAFYRLLLFAGGIIAILKGMRLPYSWPVTQAQIDYRYGFLRRGLFGEVCRQLHIPIWRYSVFTIVSFLLLGCLLAMLAVCMRRSGLDVDGLGAFSALLAGSFLISTLVNLVGFYDIVMGILVLLTMLCIAKPRLHLLAVAVAGIVGVLVHELYMIAFLPVSLTASVCWATEEQRERTNLRRWGAVLLAGVLPLPIVFLIARQAAMTPSQGKAMAASIHARVDFAPYDALFNMLTSTSGDNLRLMSNVMRSGSWWVEEAYGLAAFLPLALFFLVIALQFPAGRRPIVRAWLIGSTFCPLLLNFVGLDRFRWLAFMALNACLGAISVAYVSRMRERVKTANPRPTFATAWRRAAVFLLVIQMSTDIGFFLERGKSFPFHDYWSIYREAHQQHRSVFRPPYLFPNLKP